MRPIDAECWMHTGGLATIVEEGYYNIVRLIKHRGIRSNLLPDGLRNTKVWNQGGVALDQVSLYCRGICYLHCAGREIPNSLSFLFANPHPAC